MNNAYISLAFGAIAALGTCFGILLILYRKEWALRNSCSLNSFAAGIILAVAFVHLLPASMKMNEHAALYVFGGFIVFYLLETFFILHSSAQIHYSENLAKKTYKGTVMFSGLLFHSFIDGIVIGTGFEVDMRLGILASISVIAHEVPEGISTLTLMMRSMDIKKAVKLSLGVAFATPAGVVVTILLFSSSSPAFLSEFMGAVLAVAAGSFFYIGASDLIPETHQEHEDHAGLNAFVLIMGAILILITGLVFG